MGRCASCGHEYESGQQFCSMCGKRLPAADSGGEESKLYGTMSKKGGISGIDRLKKGYYSVPGGVRDHTLYETPIYPASAGRRPGSRISWGGQILIYLGKCFRIFVNEMQWKNFISALIIVLIISSVTSKDMFRVYLDTKNGAFAIICACVWIGLFNSIQSICRERSIVKKEHRTGLYISSYIMAHVLYEAALCAAETLIVLVVMEIKNASHLPLDGLVISQVVDMFFILFLVTFGSDMLAMLVSCIVHLPSTAMTVMPFILIIQLVMSGAVFPLNGGAKAVANVTLSKWGLDSIVAISSLDEDVWNGGAEFVARQKADPDDLSSAQTRRMQGLITDKEYFDEMRDMAEGGTDAFKPERETVLRAEGVLLSFSVLYILLSIVFLSQVDRDKR